MKTFLGAPIRIGDESLGNLYLTEKNGGKEFTQEDERLLSLFAAQAALAMRNARLHLRVEAERRRLEVLVDTCPIGVVVAEAGTGNVLLSNRDMERILGFPYRRGDLLERREHGVTFLRPDGTAYETEDLPLEGALAHGESILAEEILFRFDDGRTLPTLVNATPVYTSDGRITAAIAIIQDISPLEEIEKLRSEFLGMVSHELKTPLTAIKGSAATVLGSKRPFNVEETTELFQIIDEQADRLRDMVDNLLDMTRIEAGRLSVTAEPADLRSIIDEAVKAFGRSGVGHEVEVHLSDGFPPVNADRRRIVQVMTNLLGNAVKFSPPPRVRSRSRSIGMRSRSRCTSVTTAGESHRASSQSFSRSSPSCTPIGVRRYPALGWVS